MAEDVQYTPEQCPAAGSQEADDMAPLKETYMSVVGALLWLAACTRPDLTYTTSVLARFVSNPARSPLCGDAARPGLLAGDAGRQSGAAAWLEAEWCRHLH